MTISQIKHAALAVMLGAVVAVLVDVALNGIMLVAESARQPVPGRMLTMVMGRLTWAALAAVLWVAAPLLSRLLFSSAIPERHAPAPIDIFWTAGWLMICFPVLWIVATWLVAAVKITVVGSWSTEGQIFGAGYYYRNLVIANLPWLIGGLVLIKASRWFNDEATAA